MDWVETTGRSLDEAKEAALDQLGVAEDEADFEVLEEPQRGLFGRIRGEARVKARVRPIQPRPKVERKRPQRRRKGEPGAGRASRGPRKGSPKPSEGNKTTGGDKPGRADQRSGGRRRAEQGHQAQPKSKEGKPMSEISLEEQGAIVEEFVGGLVEAFGLDGDLELVMVDDETAEVKVSGSDLGLLIGPRGQTLQAIQSLSRTVVQRHSEGERQGRVNVDVGGYRERRKAALEEFARQVAEEVLATGAEKALEPMGATDRKIVHDAVGDVEGVSTVSEGEDPERRVVILRSGD